MYSPHGLSALSKLSLLRPSLIRQPTIDPPPAISGRSFTAFEKSARSGYSGAFWHATLPRILTGVGFTLDYFRVGQAVRAER